MKRTSTLAGLVALAGSVVGCVSERDVRRDYPSGIYATSKHGTVLRIYSDLPSGSYGREDEFNQPMLVIQPLKKDK